MSNEHPVARKLRTEILPYFVSAHRLRYQWFYWLHKVFGYSTDILVILMAIGISSPLLEFIAGVPSENGAGSTNHQISELLASVTPPYYYVTFGLVLIWATLRVTFKREEGEKRAVLARSCSLTLRQAAAKLPHVLAYPDPMPGLIELYKEEVKPIVDRNIQENVWPWTPFAPGIDKIVNSRMTELLEKYGENWSQVEQDD